MIGISEYPVPECERLVPVPAADYSWINRGVNDDIPTLGKSGTTTVRILSTSNSYQTYPIIAGPIELKDPVNLFPTASDFNNARAEIGDGSKIPAKLLSIDDKLRGCLSGYEQLVTGLDYYFLTNLQLKRSQEPGRFVGQLYTSVFTKHEHHLNSIHEIVRTFARFRGRNRQETKSDKDCLLVFLRIVLRIYAVINQRMVYRAPDEDKKEKYAESDQPFALMLFDQRDLCVTLDFEEKVLKPALEQYKTLDMGKFAQEHNFTEFFWLCCGFARCIAADMSLTIFPAEAVSDYCEKHMSEHMNKYLPQGRIRTIHVKGLATALNKLAEEFKCEARGILFVMGEKTVGGAGAKKGYTVIDKHVVSNTRVTTPWLAFAKKELHKINWPGFLAKYRLLTWTGMDPSKADWDMSMAHRKTHFHPQESFVEDVAMAQFIINHGSFVCTKNDPIRPVPAAFPPINTLRQAYTFYRDKPSRLCFTPPLLDIRPDVVAPAVTSPLNIQFPACRYLIKQAQSKATPADASMRRIEAYNKSKGGADEVAIGEGLFISTTDVAIRELFGPPKLPLPWRVQMIRNTGYSRLCPLPGAAPGDPVVPENLQSQLPWGDYPTPLPGVLDTDAYDQTALMRLNKVKGLNSKGDLCDAPLVSWNMYRGYLQGCVLYKKEVDVIRHMLVAAYGSIGAFSSAVAKAGLNAAVYSTLSNVQWGERLWREMLYIATIDTFNPVTAPVIREARQEFIRRYPQNRKIGQVGSLVVSQFIKMDPTHAKVAKPALQQSPEFWKELLHLYKAKCAPPEAGLLAIDAVEALGELVGALATGRLDVPSDELECKLFLESPPASDRSCVTPLLEKLEPVSWTTYSASVKGLRDIAVRHVIMPLCLLASTMFPSPDAVKITSPVDGKAYAWSKVPLVPDKEPLVVVICREVTSTIQRLIKNAGAGRWKVEAKLAEENVSKLQLGSLIALTETATKYELAEHPTETASNAFVDKLQNLALHGQTTQLVKFMFKNTLDVTRPNAVAPHVDAETIAAAGVFLERTMTAKTAKEARERIFKLLQSELSVEQLASTRRQMGTELRAELELFLGTHEVKPQTPKPLEHKAEGPDPTARVHTRPQQEDLFGDEDEQTAMAELMQLQAPKAAAALPPPQQQPRAPHPLSLAPGDQFKRKEMSSSNAEDVARETKRARVA